MLEHLIIQENKMEYLSGNFLCETIVPKGELIVSRTNLKGIITYSNETFAQISGYKIDELISIGIGLNKVILLCNKRNYI